MQHNFQFPILPCFGLALILIPSTVSGQTATTPPPSNNGPIVHTSLCGGDISPQGGPNTNQGSAVAAPSSNKSPARVRANFCGFDISEKAGQSPNQGGGASRGDSAPKLYAPILGKTYTVTPQFQWQALDPDAKVTFHLMTPDGTTVYEAAAAGGHFNYPASAPALTPGTTYRWTVIPADDDLYAGLPAPVSFVVVSGAERGSIAAELAPLKDRTAMAAVYVKHRLWYDSLQAYSEILDRTPGNRDARVARAELYDELPVTWSLADAEWRLVQ